MEGTAEVGSGKLFVIGDSDMFTEYYMSNYPTGPAIARNIAKWALGYNLLKGKVTPADFTGALVGMTLDLAFYQNDTLAFQDTVPLDATGNYECQLSQAGTFDIVAKCDHWLSRRVSNVDLSVSNPVIDWDLAVNGDTDHNNAIGLYDLNPLFVGYGDADPSIDLDGDGVITIKDINLVFVNFGMAGE